MIKIVITSDSSPPVTWNFKTFPIVIGNEKSSEADLKLSGQSLQERHVEINEHTENGKTHFFATNIANDPFVTLNNLPFGRQPLYVNDVIQVGDHFLRFEGDVEIGIPHPSLSGDDQLKNPPIHQETEGTSSQIDTSLEKKSPPVSPSSLQPEKITRSEYGYPYSQPSFPKGETPHSPPPVHAQKLSLKDFYLSEYDDHEDSLPFEKKTNQFISPQITKSWRAYFTIIFGFVGLIALLTSILYFWVSDQTEEEETKAAKGVADIAMALTHAQLKNIYPQNQNWSYPEFIKNNLTSILAPNYISLADVDAHGQFANCPYTLRIHTSSDLSQFLVIAQPAPSLIQWLIPKASIVIDSRIMEMRKIKDLKALNRLIVNSNNLERISANEISNLVKQGELIPLSTLINKAENQGLAPPKALGLIRPGAENFVYNAPRYYLLGEIILNNSMEVFDRKTGNKESTLLQHELNNLLNFPDFVLYSSGGIQQALKAQRALAIQIPKERYLIAYIQLNAHGKITGTHLLMDDIQPEIAIGENHSNPINENFDTTDSDNVSHKNSQQTTIELIKEDVETNRLNDIDNANPLLEQLQELTQSRQTVLNPMAREIITLVKKHTTAAQPEFNSQFTSLLEKYQEADLVEQNKIFAKFSILANNNASLSAVKFLGFIKAANLKGLFRQYLQQMQNTSTESQVTTEQFEQQLEKIHSSITWDDLELNVAQINQLLRFDRLSDQDRLVAFQNTARSVVTKKLNQFILSNEALPENTFNQEHLVTLTSILKSVWITDPDTRDFYIAEFELREQN